MISFSTSVDASKKIASGSRYQLLGIAPEEGSSAVDLAANSTSRTTFELPAGQVYNLSESKLRFTIAVAQPTNSQLVHVDKPPISRVSLQTRGGQYLCEIPSFGDFWKVCKQGRDYASYASQPLAYGGSTKADAQARGVITFHQPFDDAPNSAPTSNASNGARISNVPTTVELNGWRREDGEVSYITSADNTAMYLNCQLDLGMIRHTVFALKQNFCAPEVLQLVIEWQPFNEIASDHTVVGTLAGAAAPTGAVSIEDLRMYLAIEQNESARIPFLQKMASAEGLSFTIPFPLVQSYSLGANASGSVNMRINRGHGERLLRVLSAERLTATANASNSNFYNVLGAKTQVYHTEVNSTRLQPENLSSVTGTDWLFNAPMYKGTAAVSVSDWRSVCPAHVDDFSACVSLAEADEKDFYVDGLDLSVELLWSKVIDQKTATPTTMVVVPVVQKTLISSAAGVMTT